MDMIGPLPLTPRGNRYILTMIDGYSKWAEAIPSPSQSAIVTARLIINEWIARHGAPVILHSDLGANFTSRVIKEVCAMFDTKQTHTTAYHAAGNGAVERFNRTLIDLIATGIEDARENWDLHLNLLLMAHRSTITTHGYTPFFILHGFEMKMPLDLQYGLPPSHPTGDFHEVVRSYHEAINRAYANARVNLDAAHQSQQNAYDRRARGTRYNAGDKVYVFTPVVKTGKFHKFDSYWDGPVTVTERVTDVDYVVRDATTNKTRMVHFDRLKPAYSLPKHLEENEIESETDVEEEDDLYFQAAVPNQDETETIRPRAAPEKEGDEMALEERATPKTDTTPALQALAHQEHVDAQRRMEARVHRQRPQDRKEDNTVLQPAVRDRERAEKARAYELRPRIPGNRRYQDYVMTVDNVDKNNELHQTSPSFASRSHGSKSAATYWLTLCMMICTVTATSSDIESSSIHAIGTDGIVIPELGTVAVRCGQVVIEHQRLMFNMVLHLNLTISAVMNVSNNCGDVLFEQKELQQLADYATLDSVLAIPTWLQASVRLPDGRYLDEVNAESIEHLLQAASNQSGVPADEVEARARTRTRTRKPFVMTIDMLNAEYKRRRELERNPVLRPFLNVSEYEWNGAYIRLLQEIHRNWTQFEYRKHPHLSPHRPPMPYPPGAQNNRSRREASLTRRKRFFGFDPVSFAIATAATAMATYSIIEINSLKSRLNDLSHHVQVLDDRITEAHNTLIKVAQSQRDLYHYTQKSFSDVAAYLDSFVCNTRNAIFLAAMISRRNHAITKLYTDLSAIINSMFSGRLSPIIAPERTIRRLVRINEHILHDTVFWDDPLSMYRYAAVVPVWPLTIDKLAYVLVIPDLKRPTLAPLYCTTSVGTLINAEIARRFEVPPKLINQIESKDAIDTMNGHDDNDETISKPSTTTVQFAIPELDRCRLLDDETLACRAAYGIQAWKCLDNTTECPLTVKHHLEAEYAVTNLGYAIRSAEPCHILDINGTQTPIQLEQGFAFVPFNRHGTLKCGGSLAIPLEIRGVELQYVYEVKPFTDFNVSDYTTINNTEWIGVGALESLIAESKARALEWTLSAKLRHAYNNHSHWVIITVAVVAALALLIGLLLWCRLRAMTLQPVRYLQAIEAEKGKGESPKSKRRRAHAVRKLLQTGEITLPNTRSKTKTKITKVPVWRRIRNSVATLRKKSTKNIGLQATCAIEAAVQTNSASNETMDMLDKSPPTYDQTKAYTSLYPTVVITENENIGPERTAMINSGATRTIIEPVKTTNKPTPLVETFNTLPSSCHISLDF